jgi:DNA-binding response OmpR family regulator
MVGNVSWAQAAGRGRVRFRITVLDGSHERSKVACSALEQAGYLVERFATLRAAEISYWQPPDLLLAAVNLPDGNEIDTVRRIRGNNHERKPRTILVAASREEGARLMLEVGAEGFISSPFTPNELISCVQAVLQHAFPLPIPGASTPAHADIVIDPSAMKVVIRGHEVPTTTLEYRLIEYMARHNGKVFTRDALLDALWGDLRFVTPRSVDACVGRIRGKIEADRSAPTYLKTVRGIGYKLDASTHWKAAVSDSCQCLSCSMLRVSRTVSNPPSDRTGT